MIKTIVFDFGNVIGLFSHRLASERLAAYSDLSVDAVHAILWDSPLEDDYEAGRVTTDEFLRRVRAECHLTCPDDILRALYTDIFYASNPELIALLPHLKPRYRLLLASNTNEIHARRFLEQFADSVRWFDALVLSHEAGTRKPARAFFEYCQRLVQCAPDECVFIDDLPANVAGARTHGWRVILYTNVDDLRRQFAALGVLV
jgi:putative hydrolase of the HAD superfamily